MDRPMKDNNKKEIWAKGCLDSKYLMDRPMRIEDLHEYQALKKHMREHLDDYDMDDIEKKRFELFCYNADREINALLDRVELEREKSHALLQMYFDIASV